MEHHVRDVIARSKGTPVGTTTVVMPDPGPGEALLMVKACGVCHTDQHFRESGIDDNFPFPLGHEPAGTADAVGPDVTGLAPGDVVGVPTPEMMLEIPLLDVFGRGGALKSSWYGDCLPTRDSPMLIDLYLQNRLNLEAFVSETIGLDDVEQAFDRTQAGDVPRSVVVMK